ncbi:hypothetical protein CB0940_07807 [Cercospora beticola]|uniref:Uncharacterized protein n=1 Tax=Cercospora beticola TaxID=122368 RepID=A0A2G5H8L7_CERBT|nr:hypothetical protein CB0940_07807 [Cercospora beticola]PIA88878.1 hypothetical protein CB0940_07807 [Cercospora beticola]WPB03775.1 hypothetical protein RHO25_008419 [Cercospora beticola]CAK1357458.1 unnamed protein product [Cercospora beticola]
MSPTTRSKAKGSGPRRSDRLRAKRAELNSTTRPGARPTLSHKKKVAAKPKPKKAAPTPKPKKVAPKPQPKKVAHPSKSYPSASAQFARDPDPVPQDATGNEPQQPTLLTIAPELRNMIYEYALVESRTVQIRAGAREPGLLAVCRQIRAEARGIWLSMNTFRFTIRDCDGRQISSFHQHASKLKKISLNLRGNRKWDNIITWAHLVYQHRGYRLKIPHPGLRTKVPRSEMWDIVHTATSMAHDLSHLPWPRVQKNLELIRIMAAYRDKSWLN